MIVNYILFFILYWVFRNKRENPLEMQRHILREVVIGLILSTLSITLYALILIASGYSQISYSAFNLGLELKKVAMMAASYLGVSLFEEYLFRYLLYEWLYKWFKLKWPALLSVAIVFSGLHYMHYSQNSFMISDFASAFCISILFSLNYTRTKHLAFPIVFHTVWNVLLSTLNMDKEMNVEKSLFGMSLYVAEMSKVMYTLAASVIVVLWIVNEMRIRE